MRGALKLVSVEDVAPLAEPVIEIIASTSAHVRELMGTIRPDDRRELEAWGFTCGRGLWRSYKHGLMNHTATIDGKVAAMWGVGGIYMGTVGQPWLLTSLEVKKMSPLKFAKIYQREVKKMLKVFKYLENYVLSDYNEAVRLLQIVGFKIGDPEPAGSKGELFCKFSMGEK